MPVTHLELENFKSYAGSQRVGPFSDFTSVIGPNGAGKSNLMDAISFVLGVQSRELRSSQLKDLIFRAPGSSLDGVRCSATLVYEDDEGTETRFSRSISPSGVGDYKVNGKVMGRAAYEKELAEIGVLVKARNFLVFQGDVESLARKSPSELVDLLETISGSAEYKAAYDAAVAEKEEAEHARLFATKQKKILEIERKQLKEQKDEAERFHALLDERSQVSTELYLWQLYHLDQDRIERETIVKELASDLEEAAETEAQAASELKAIKKAASEARRDTAAADKHRVLLATKCDEHGPNIIKMAEKMGALKKSISKDESQLETKRIDKSTHGAKLAKISDDIEEYKQTELDLVKDFEEAKSKLLEAAGEGVVQLTAAQEEEYEKVKEAAAVAGAEPRRVLAAVRLKLDSAHDAISTAKTEHSDAQKLHAKLQQEVQDLTTRHTNSTKVMICIACHPIGFG